MRPSWLLGPNWPNSGEVDIIEGVNSATTNQMTLHSTSGCTITRNGLSSGNILGTNCDVAATGNQGCSIATSNTQTYGAGFNAANGGVYATEWTSDFISIWFFPRNAIPSDITAGTPNPDNWGLALAQFSGCDLDRYFVNQQIIFDTTFCGDWASAVWSTDPVCSQKASTCIDYVQNNPGDFTDAYWGINGLKVYQDNGAAAPPAVATGTTTTAATNAGTATPTSPFSFPTTFATSSTTGFGFGASATPSLSNPFFTSTPTTFSNALFTPSSTFSNANTFFTAAPTGSFGFSAASSSWSSWRGGQGGARGGRRGQ